MSCSCEQLNRRAVLETLPQSRQPSRPQFFAQPTLLAYLIHPLFCEETHVYMYTAPLPPLRFSPPPPAPFGQPTALTLSLSLNMKTDVKRRLIPACSCACCALFRYFGGTAERGTADAVLLHERSVGREHGGQSYRLRQDLHER